MKQFFYTGFLLLSLLMLPGFMQAQRVVSGVITDAESGEPLLGVTVQVVGTSTGAISDLDGNYSVRVNDEDTELRFAYTGYEELIVPIGTSNTLNVQMKGGSLLNELVIIGYGTVEREDLTGALLEVDQESFNKGAINSPQELIVGKIAGVQVTPAPEPGGAATIRIRGGSSLSAENDPLIVIDGIPVDNGLPGGGRNALNVVNPNDIETFTVLKDASATAIYGSRASNGVILITTKKGSLGTPLQVSYNGNVSFANKIATVDVLNGDEFRALINERFADGHPARDLLGNANTDWQEEVYQQAVGHDHNLSFNGAMGQLPYRLSMGYTNRNGIVKTDNFERFTAGLTLTPSFFENALQVRVNLKEVVENNVFANRDAIGAAVAMDPTQEIFVADTTFGGYYTWLQSDGVSPNPNATKNPVALLEQKQDVSSVERFIANVQADYRFWFLPDLHANLNVGYDRLKGGGTTFEPANASFQFVQGGLDKEYSNLTENSLLEFYLNYKKKFGNSSFDIMGGYSWQHFYFDDFEVSRSLTGMNVADPDPEPKEYYLLSLYGRVNLNIGSRLLLTGTVRRDGTSRFSEENRWGIFPAAAVAFKAIDDRPGALNSLKLRVSYGETGQQAITDDLYPYLPIYVASTSTAQYQLGNQFYTTLRPGGYNANLRWETTTTYNAGIDFALLNNRVFGSLEYYIRETSDLINFLPVPAGTNLTNEINSNIGTLENRGIELSLNTVPVQTDRIRWELGGNLTINNNEITKLTATDIPGYLGVATGDISGGVGNKIQIHSEGYAANSFFVYEQVYDDNGVPIEGLYVDRNGDGQFTAADRYQFEDPNADYFIGFFSNFNVGNVDFSFGGRANIGNYMYNNTQSNVARYSNLYYSTGYLSNVTTDITDLDINVPQYFSDHFIQDASFLRFDHITLGYTFPTMNRISRLRVYATVQNPILVTKYEGLDPEVFDGIDNNVYPRSRTLLFGVNADF